MWFMPSKYVILLELHVFFSDTSSETFTTCWSFYIVYWLGAMMDIEMLLFIFHLKQDRWLLNGNAIFVNTTVHVRQ